MNKETKVIYCQCNFPYWVNVAEKLQQQLGWEPCYWTGVEGMASIVKERFPDVIFHDYIDAIRSIPADSMEDVKPMIVDQKIMKELIWETDIARTMMDRLEFDANALNNRERTRLFVRYLEYWGGVLDVLQPDVFVTPVLPHAVFNYVLYVLCLHRGIKTIMFSHTCWLDMFIPMERFEDGPVHFHRAYQNDLLEFEKTRELSVEADAYIQRLSRDYERAKPQYMRQHEQTERSAKIDKIKRFMSPTRYINALNYRILGRLSGKTMPQRGFGKVMGRNMEDPEISYSEFISGRKKHVRYKHELAKCYKFLVSVPDYTVPYIYIPLHYEPEATMCPIGDVFSYQFLLISMISRLVPQGWYVYVKENPIQQSVAFGGRGREKSLYTDILALGNAKLMPMNTSSFDLIDNAKAVAAVSGTAIWESVVRGKPALLFSKSWQYLCEGVFYTPDTASCKQAIDSIADGYVPSLDKVKLFLATLEAHGYRCSVETELPENDWDSNASIVVQAIRNYHEQIGGD
jgi:hypothetical protein